jgi:hypothetical protein
VLAVRLAYETFHGIPQGFHEATRAAPSPSIVSALKFQGVSNVQHATPDIDDLLDCAEQLDVTPSFA